MPHYVKKKQLEYSVRDGVTVGENWEPLALKIAPKDLLSINKAIRAIVKNGGVPKILKSIK